MTHVRDTVDSVNGVDGLDRANAKSKRKHDSMENDLVPFENNVVSGTESASTFGTAAGGEAMRDVTVFVRVSNSFLCPLRAVFLLSLPCVRDTVDGVDSADGVDCVDGIDRAHTKNKHKHFGMENDLVPFENNVESP